MKIKTAIATAVLAATAALSLPGAAQAASPGDLCRVAGGTGGGPVFHITTGNLLYIIPEGGYFRVEDYGPMMNPGIASYIGHGASQPTGKMARWVINQSSCTS